MGKGKRGKKKREPRILWAQQDQTQLKFTPYVKRSYCTYYLWEITHSKEKLEIVLKKIVLLVSRKLN